MRVPWSDPRCIICLREPQKEDASSQRTDAHVIPESLGGQLSAKFLCKRCNSNMGTVESRLQKDTAIIELVRRLRADLPDDLARGVVKHAGWFADTAAYGRLEGNDNTEGDFALRQSPSIFTDDNMIRKIRAELRRRGASAEEIAAKVTEFERADESTKLEIAPGFTTIKHIDLSEVSFQRTFDEKSSHDPDKPFGGPPPAIPLGIAFTFLALLAESRIYNEEFDPAREVLRRVAVDFDIAAGDSWPIDSLHTSPAEPKHALAVVNTDDGCRVQIWLFREFVWHVHFPSVQVKGEPFYLLDLVTGEESFA